MKNFPRLDTTLLFNIFLTCLGSFLVVYLLRIFRLVTFLPGGIILILLLLTIITGIIWGIEKTKSF